MPSVRASGSLIPTIQKKFLSKDTDAPQPHVRAFVDRAILVVEHEPKTIVIADHVVDLGPGAGSSGGTVCFEGTVKGLRTSGTITVRHLDDGAALKPAARKPTGSLEIRNVTVRGQALRGIGAPTSAPDGSPSRVRNHAGPTRDLA